MSTEWFLALLLGGSLFTLIASGRRAGGDAKTFAEIKAAITARGRLLTTLLAVAAVVALAALIISSLGTSLFLATARGVVASAPGIHQLGKAAVVVGLAIAYQLQCLIAGFPDNRPSRQLPEGVAP
ncbi:hypothetical protein [Nonomuraea dietziae]|uniref:hypothetical protein n=1 Tax=Nonomuraea dietziae TaxID=65515 RepID=UPI0033FD533B